MTPGIEALRSNRVVVASVVAAAVAFTALCLVGVARLAGWAPVAQAGTAANSPPAAPGIDLLPGETLVEAPAAGPRTEPLMPTYSPPAVPKAAPPASAEEAAAATGPPPAVQPPIRIERSEPARPPRPGPSMPQYARRETHPTDPMDDWPRSVPCRNCGTVTSITPYADAYEVRVRFEDGAARIVRFRSSPPWRIGDRVRLENGRLESQ